MLFQCGWIGRWNAIGYSVLSFSLIISFWWQYFDILEKKIDKTIKTKGQIILYGHLFIYISLSMIAASIQLLFNKEISYYFILNFIFGAALIYFLSTTLVFHKYRYEDQKLKIIHLSMFLSIILSFFIFDIFIPVSGIIILLQINVFLLSMVKFQHEKLSLYTILKFQNKEKANREVSDQHQLTYKFINKYSMFVHCF